MNRRSFLKYLSQGALLSYGYITCPDLVYSKEAFDYALECRDFIQNRQFEKAVEVLKKAISLDYQVNRVIIDAENGGFDSGAFGRDGIKEKDVTLDPAKRVHEIKILYKSATTVSIIST